MRKVKTFYNNVFNNRRINGSVSLGSADPFIFKYNGFYYLTCTRPKGLVLMKSFDLLKWENVNDNGIVGDDEYLKYAFAPEITYYNGYFYFVSSPCGNGHHIYRSMSIDGPFIHHLGNFEELIDGSFFLDSDEKKYFLRASETGITIKRFKESEVVSDFSLFDEYYNFKESVIGNWTEGPYLLKRYGYYYLTYTGTHFLSNAYRVDYASGKKIGSNDLKYKDTILLSTDDEFYGLGHSMTFLGPDLDSYYIAYHNMMPNKQRYLNISRLMFNKSGEMMVNGAYIKNNLMFKRPLFEKFIDKNNFISELTFNNKCFSCEYNFIGKDVKLLLGYKNERNYQYFSLKNNCLELIDVINQKESVTYSYRFNNIYDLEVFHCLRVQYAMNEMTLYFDNMEIVYKAKVHLNKGKIGFLNNKLTPAYIAYSSKAYGTSDIEMIKNDSFYLDNCLKENKLLSTKFTIFEKGEYLICLEQNSSCKIKNLKIDGINQKENIVTSHNNEIIGKIFLSKGVHNFEIDSINSKNKLIRFIKFDDVNDLNQNSFIANSRVFGRYITLNDKVYFENDRNAIITNQNYFNYELQVKINIVGYPVKDDNFVGLIANSHHYSKSNEFENAYSLQGYLFVINAKKAFIIDANYAHSKVLKKINIKEMKGVTLKIIKEKYRILFYINNVLVYETFTNKYISGQCGIYNNHASGIFSDYYLKVLKEEI